MAKGRPKLTTAQHRFDERIKIYNVVLERINLVLTGVSER
jgi:hypothetical protein